MLKTERMYKLTVVGARKHLEKVIGTLYNLGTIHIKEYEKEDEFFDIGKPSDKAERISKLLIKIRSTLSMLPSVVNVEKPSSGNFKKFDELEMWCSEIHKEIEELQEKLRKLSETKNKLKAEMEQLSILEKLGLSPEILREYESISWIILVTKDKELIQKLKEKLRDDCEVSAVEHEGKVLIAIFFRKSVEKKVNEILTEYEHTILDLSGVQGMKGDTSLLKRKFEREIERINKESAQIKSKLRDKARKIKPVLLYWKRVLEEEAEKAEAPLKFATTDNVFMLKGWVPKRNAREVKKSLEKITGGKIFLKFEEVDEHREEAPVKFSHPKGVDNFQYFMEMYSLPRYSEIDPTLFVALTFPIYFGFILGDVGYGLVSLAAFLFLRKKFRNLKKLMNIFIFSAITTIIFGFVYGEFFGMNEIAGIKLPVIIHRVHETITLLLISVAIGIIHVNLGFILGIINEWKLHGFRKALFEKISWLVVEAGVGIYYLTSKGYLGISPDVGLIVLIVGISMLAKGEGIKGVVELPTLLSHTLSYARLMGAGIASAGLAAVINSIAGQLVSKGPAYIILAALLVIVGHVMNILLGLMEGFLHSLRLNYVEFFTKFFEGGGFPYTPFGKRKS